MRRFKITLLGISLGFFLGALLFQQLFSPCQDGLFIGLVLFVVYGFVFLHFIHRYTYPLEKILEAAKPFLKGKLPYLVVEDCEKIPPFGSFVEIFNSLSEKIHAHIQLSQEKDREIDGLLDSLNEGVIAFNMRAKIIFVNQLACSLLNLSKESLMGRSIRSLNKQEPFSQKCHEIVQHVLQTSESVTEKWAIQETNFDLVGSPLLHQKGAILVIQDKTSDYKILEMGKNFIANASHELRTPITIIRGFAEMLQNVDHLSPEMMSNITLKIISTCDRLDKLVKSLLRLADLENFSQDRFKVCSLQSLIEHCQHLLLTAYPEVQLSVSEIDKQVAILGDFDLLDLAFMNVLENAVKYSARPSEITIGMQIEGDYIYIDFQDKGIGIPNKDLSSVFDRFYTVDKARSRKSGGAGLGLSIVKMIIEKHGGTICVASELGRGSTFSVRLPVFREISSKIV